jgi:DNA-binding NtrC family response regulator
MIDASHVSLEAGAALAEPPPTPPQVPLERGSSVTSAAPSAGATSGAAGLNDEVRDLESRRVREALAACAGNQSRAAKMLGISRRALLRRIEDFGIERPRKRAAD